MRRVVLDHMAASWFKTCFGFIPSCYLGWSLAQTCWMLQAPALMPGRGGSSSIIPVDSVSFCTKWLRRLWAKGSGDSTVCWLRRSPGGEAESSCASECWGFILFYFFFGPFALQGCTREKAEVILSWRLSDCFRTCQKDRRKEGIQTRFPHTPGNPPH